MGAWGLGLFESDHDLDVVWDLSHEAGLAKLQEEAIAKAEAAGVSVAKPDLKPGRAGDVPISYSLDATICTDVDVVRTFLESSGALDKLIQKYGAEGAEAPSCSLLSPGYTLVLIGACAMRLGCTLKDDFLETLRRTFTEVGLMRDALKQMDTALNGPGGFENGKPYKWGSFGIHEKVKNPAKDLIYPNMLNVPSPDGMHRGPDTFALVRKIKLRMAAVKEEKPGNVCGACAAAQGENGALLVCSKCKKRKYCGARCQKEHWKMHKLVCVAPVQAESQFRLGPEALANELWA